MSFNQCRIKNNLAHIIQSDPTLQTAGNGIDFTTGDVSGGYTGIYRAFDFDTGQGSTISATLAALDTVVAVTSTTGMTTGEQIGIELDNGNYFWTTATVDNGTQVTLDEGISSAATSGNDIVSAGQLDTSTSGSVIQDFKFPKVRTVVNRTDRLINRGVDHADREFGANEEIISILSIADNSSLANGSFFVPDRDNRGYAFADASDYNTFVDAVATRNRQMRNNSGGEMALVESVQTADNTLVAMDAISDTRS